MIGLMLAAASAAAGPAVLTDRESIAIDGRSIRVGDVIEGIAGSRVAGVEIARVPATRTVVALSRRALVSLIRRAAPGFVVTPRGDGTVVFHVTARSVARHDPCWRTTTIVAAGETIGRDRVMQGTCDGASAAAHFDRRGGTIVADAALPVGSVIGRVAPPPAPVVARGGAMTLIARTGVVTVERPVVALQPGRAGRRVFVRDGAGHVFAATVEGEAR